MPPCQRPETVHPVPAPLDLRDDDACEVEGDGAAAVLTMPFDLMRHDMLMIYQPIPPERVLAIVDDLFMPLVTMDRPG